MKFTNLRAFEKHVEGAAPQQLFTPIYLILGEDRFARKVAADRLISALTHSTKASASSTSSSKSENFCLKIFQADKSPIDSLMQELESLTLFAERQVILLEDAEKLNKASMKALEAYFNYPNPSLIFIISAESIHRATNFYKYAEKGGVVLEFAEEKPIDKEKALVEWARNQLMAQGKGIEAKACQTLVKQLGADMSLLSQEIEKLICYVGDRQQITEQDVAAICTKVNVETIWQLGEALFQKQTAAALRTSQGMLNDGVPFLTLVRQIRHQFQTDFQVCSLMAHGKGPAEITQLFPYMKGFILDKHMNVARAYGLTRFKRAMLLIDEAELQAKNSAIDQDILAERLITKLTTL